MSEQRQKEQQRVIEFLSTAEAYTTRYLGNHHNPRGVASCQHEFRTECTEGFSVPRMEDLGHLRDKDVKKITTHTAHVFLVGPQLAFKLERAAKFPFLDMSTLELRRIATVKEICLNRSTSPEIYLGLVAVGTTNGGEFYLIPLDHEHDTSAATLPLTDPEHRQRVGQSHLEVVEYLVEMRQFKQDAVLYEVAKRGGLTRQMMEDIVEQTVLFHSKAAVHHEEEVGSQAMQWVADDNLKEMVEFAATSGGDHLDADKVERVCTRCVEQTKELAPLLDRRRDNGFVRFCHGDLHLKNMVLLPGNRARLFDCIEFNDKLAISDVMYDVAFLLMDLLHQGLPVLASVVLNRYVQLTHDMEGLELLPLFLADRAIIRAKVSCAEIQSHSTDDTAGIDRLQHRCVSIGACMHVVVHRSLFLSFMFSLSLSLSPSICVGAHLDAQRVGL